jgi:hypothetical protein
MTPNPRNPRKAEPVYRVPPFGTGQDADRIL